MALLYHSMYHHSCWLFYYQTYTLNALSVLDPSCMAKLKVERWRCTSSGTKFVEGLIGKSVPFQQRNLHSFLSPPPTLSHHGIVTERPSQAFRAGPLSEVVCINTQHDLTTGQFIIRWKEIQRVFERAKHLKDGTEIIPFMTGDDLEEYDHLCKCHDVDTVVTVNTTIDHAVR